MRYAILDNFRRCFVLFLNNFLKVLHCSGFCGRFVFLGFFFFYLFSLCTEWMFKYFQLSVCSSILLLRSSHLAWNERENIFSLKHFFFFRHVHLAISANFIAINWINRCFLLHNTVINFTSKFIHIEILLNHSDWKFVIKYFLVTKYSSYHDIILH